VYRRGFETLIVGGQWWCSAWSCGRISVTFFGQWWCSAWPWIRIFFYFILYLLNFFIVGTAHQRCIMAAHLQNNYIETDRWCKEQS
jgi:hypothetical protein